MLFPVAFEDIIQHLVALLPGIVDVEVRWTGTLGIDETLEVKVQFNGVHIRDLQAVSHHASWPRCRAPHGRIPWTWNSG